MNTDDTDEESHDHGFDQKPTTSTHPERQLLIRHESFETGLAFAIRGPHFFPGGKGLIAIFVTANGRKYKKKNNP